MRFTRIMMAVAALAVAACGDDNGTGPGDSNSNGYNITINGAVQATAKGEAWFGADDVEGDAVFVLLLGAESSSHTIMLGREGTARPGVGSYDVTDGGEEDGSFSGLYIHSNGDDGAMYITESGTIQVTESSSSRLKGTIQITAVSLLGDPEDPADRVTITGSFDARSAPGSMVGAVLGL